LKQSNMSVPAVLGAISIFFASSFVMVSSAEAAGWKCSAAQLKNYSYSGGSSAMIHLRAYSKGGRYSVKKVNAKKVTGKTKDGTKFTCTKK